MPRKKLIRTTDFPYHVTTRANNREWFQLPLPEVWSYCLKSLTYAHEKIPVTFHSFVLMSNHYHLLVTTPNADLDKFMYFFNKHLADQLRVHSKRINRVFGGPYSWSLVDSKQYLFHVVRYVFQNPLRKQMVSKVEDYHFSSLFSEIRREKFPLEIHSPLDRPHIDEEILRWLNEIPSLRENSFIQKGLRKSTFALAKDSNTGKEYQTSSVPVLQS